MSKLLPEDELPSHDTPTPGDAPEADGFAGRMVV